jgi:diguanylate cyclase (GGDEF)-like protein
MSMFATMSIRTKLSAGFGSALALIVAVGLFGLYQLQSVNNVTREIGEDWLPRVEMLGEIKHATSQHRILATRRTQTTDFRALASIAQGTREALQLLRTTGDAYTKAANSPEEQQLFREFLDLWDDYQGTLAIVFQRLEAGEITAAHLEFNSVSLANFEAAAGKLDELITLSKQNSRAAAVRANKVYRLALLATIAAIAAAALLAAVGIVWASQSISSPILRISTAMQRLTAGDDSVTVVDDPGRKDEIGVLAAAATGYRDSLVRSRQLAREAELERERLQAAVSNMPIGLTMFDANQELIICNDRYAEIYGLPHELTAPGTKLVDMLRSRVSAGSVAIEDPQAYVDRVLRIVRERKPALNLVKQENGCILSVVHQPMEGGGWVATHEDVTERRRAEERIHHMARHDALTDLPNRTLFRERIEEALKQAGRQGKLAVLCIDLDHFKAVNDTLGHPVGDALLQMVADRLRGSVREDDAIARFGGDEFAVAQSATGQPEGATALAQRIIESLSKPYTINEQQVVIGASVGIAVAPTDGTAADELLRNGDLALYRAKADGRGAYRFFEPEMDARMQARRALELDLRQAFADGDFEVHYQPIIDLGTNEVSSFEALLRWRHAKRGLVAPSEFVPLAEDIGLIVPLGEWVLRRACMDAATWPDAVGVSVNLSPVQFRNKRLLESVITALARSKLPAHRLELEITEGVLLAEHEATLAALHQLRGLGVHIAMDDFGTGYSSLSYLRSFPFDKIKIDSSFIRNISDEDSSLAIIRAVTGLGASLGIATTAEGVETQDQLERVRAEGCTEVQGFFFSKARPASEIALLLRSLQQRAAAAA